MHVCTRTYCVKIITCLSTYVNTCISTTGGLKSHLNGFGVEFVFEALATTPSVRRRKISSWAKSSFKKLVLEAPLLQART